MFDESGKFEGFDGPSWTAIPDLIFDYFLAHLSGAEFKVLCYIARWTCGFRRPIATISKDQMVSGYVSKSGKRVDHGAGVSARMLTASSKDKNGNVTPNVLDRLEAMGLITRDRTFGPGIKSKATRYSLNVAPDSPLAEIFGFEPQDVAPAKLPPLTESGGAELPPLSPRRTSPPSEESKESDRETTTPTSLFGGSGPEDSEKAEAEETLEVYQPRHFSILSKEAVRDYLDQAGGRVDVLNDSLETLDRDKGRGKEIHSEHFYLLEIIRRKLEQAAHLGPAPEPETPAAGVDSEPEKSPMEQEVSRKLVAWIVEFRTAYPDRLPSPATLDFIRAEINQHGAAPDPGNLDHLPPNPFISMAVV